MDRDGQIVVGIQQPRRGRDDAVTVGVGVVGEGHVEPVLQPEQAGHRVRARAVHADLAVVIHGHERERRVDSRIDHFDVEPVERD